MRPFPNIKNTAAGLALTLALSLAAIPSTAVFAEPLSFMVFGDAPYEDGQFKMLRDTVAPKMREANVSFLIHLGDFLKTKKEFCTEPLIEERYKQLMSLHKKWVFYTPGDNEWTDCDDSRIELAANRFSEIKRLEFLRDLIRNKPMSRERVEKWKYMTQPAFPENARWTQGEVIFATVHIVGTNNGRDWITLDDEVDALDLVDARDRANRIWLNAAFGAALRSGARAVVIAIQGDVTDVFGTETNKRDKSELTPCIVPKSTASKATKRKMRRKRVKCDGFTAFRAQLLDLAAEFKKPVLLIHGDTEAFCLEKPARVGGDEYLWTRKVTNLWRLNAFGDYEPEEELVDATIVTFDLDAKNGDRPFTIKLLTTDSDRAEPCPKYP